MEARWLHEAGLIGCYDDYVALPFRVLQDARLVMAAEAQQKNRQANRAAAQQQRGARGGFRR